MRRKQLRADAVDSMVESFRNAMEARLKEKGRHSAASSHEIYGLILEEIHELDYAIRVQGGSAIGDELLDLAVAAMFGHECIKEKKVDW